MKTLTTSLFAVLIFQSLEVHAAPPEFGGHRFVCVDNGANRLLLVDQPTPRDGWSVAIPAGSRDLQRLDGGRLLVSNGNGCGIYDLKDGRAVWMLAGFSGVQTARFIPERGELVLGAIARNAAEFHFLKRDGDGFQRPGRVVRVTGCRSGCEQQTGLELGRSHRRETDHPSSHARRPMTAPTMNRIAAAFAAG